MHRPFRFAPPAPAATAVLRPRLLAPLACRFEDRLLAIEAPAGLGKTTLLAQAVAENALAPRGRDVWLTCEPADSSASVLLGALLHGLDADDDNATPTVERVCAAVWALAPTQVCLVLDDAQHIEPGSAGETTARQLLEELPENGHLLVAARRLPDLRRARLALLGRARTLGADDLELTAEEAAALARHHGTDPALVQLAGGWPALAELHARLGTDDARRFVWEEVVAPLPDADRAAFLFLVGVGGADRTALDAALGEGFDASRLASLPLVAVDEHGGLRPHPIWEDLLRDRIDAHGAAAARAALAEVLVTRGDTKVAFELLASNGAWDRALAVLFDACNAQHQPPWPDQMVRWRRLVPAELSNHPEVRYLDAMIERAEDVWAPTVQRAFDDALAGFRARGDVLQEVTASVRSCYLAWLTGDLAAFAAMRERGEELLAQGWPVAPILDLNTVFQADLRGDHATVLAATTGIREVEPRLRHLVSLLRVFAHLEAGDADAAVADARASAASAEPVAPAAGTGWAAFAPALVAWTSGDLAAAGAEPHVDPGPRHAIAERVAPMVLGCVLAAHLGDPVGARRQLEAVEALVPDVADRELLVGLFAVARATVAMSEGDEVAAARVLADHLDGRSLDPMLAGRALRWFPALPHVLHEPSRRVLDELPSGPARARVLDACRALVAAREGRPWREPALLADPDALLAALPCRLATELVVHAAAAGAPRARDAIKRLAELAPDATRSTLAAVTAGGTPSASRAARSLLGAVPIPPTHTVRIEVLGTARLLVDGEPVTSATWRRQRVRQLLCALVAHREIRRARLGVLLWPDFDDDGVSQNLRMTLSYAQSLLEPGRARGHAPWFLRQDAGVLRLAGGDRLSVDAWELEASLDAAATASASGVPSVELEHLLGAVDRWQGPYLDDVAGEEWAEPLRERFHSRFGSAAVRAGELLVAAGRPADAVRAADAALAADPWSEAAYRVLASAHLALGDDDAVRRTIEAATRRLADLGIEPGADTVAIGRRPDR